MGKDLLQMWNSAPSYMLPVTRPCYRHQHGLQHKVSPTLAPGKTMEDFQLQTQIFLHSPNLLLL